MLNTDRGADNYMIKYCEGDHEKSLVDVAPSRSDQMPVMSELRKPESSASAPRMNVPSPYPSVPTMEASRSSTPQGDYTRRPHIHIAAIDNSLSFPHEHPQGEVMFRTWLVAYEIFRLAFLCLWLVVLACQYHWQAF